MLHHTEAARGALLAAVARWREDYPASPGCPTPHLAHALGLAEADVLALCAALVAQGRLAWGPKPLLGPRDVALPGG